ncbi:hypothetical protein M441DRAFT_247337 [Trichoderma asperellum CBS 433.97]|uniref:Secreted protein n=1 Tax=Trichoderma asperellum (strain ATCC 204424 / CBS 433.97 / NBRC 101777) TaxID=1042311 RepID=A0A2T3Z014_TRIA4|nr:hypothetical protein M441DRAFT_247337 [Trichoderma asperellum CBS 433.97]PTB38156.1 hypothetical protein M441DRAFT_247337 [Trichoderma asperellum CBS 433.97]
MAALWIFYFFLRVTNPPLCRGTRLAGIRNSYTCPLFFSAVAAAVEHHRNNFCNFLHSIVLKGQKDCKKEQELAKGWRVSGLCGETWSWAGLGLLWFFAVIITT